MESGGNCSVKRGLILDVDGTLWDAVDVITDSWNQALKSAPDVKGTITGEDMRRCLGKTMFEIADMMFPYLPKERRREVLGMAMRFEVEYMWEHPGLIYPGVKETLHKLKDSGWHLYIVSNCQKGYIEDFLRALGDEGLIEDHICFEDTLKDKGSNIRLCVERNDISRAVYVGDTCSDLTAARAAGTEFIHAAYGFGEINADRERIAAISAFSHLPEALT